MNSNLFKKAGIILGVLFVLIQFIQPARNEGMAVGPDDITQVIAMTASVQQTIEKSCYDCHSNHTNYPWYARIQPFGFWLKNHVDEGKEELNFTEFAAYTPKRKAKKMHEIAEMLEEGEMPLPSYTLIHRDAILTDAQKNELIAWAKENERILKGAPVTETHEDED